VRQVATHSDVQILPAEAIRFEGLSFSPDGNYVYFAVPTAMIPVSSTCTSCRLLAGRRGCW